MGSVLIETAADGSQIFHAVDGVQGMSVYAQSSSGKRYSYDFNFEADEWVFSSQQANQATLDFDNYITFRETEDGMSVVVTGDRSHDIVPGPGDFSINFDHEGNVSGIQVGANISKPGVGVIGFYGSTTSDNQTNLPRTHITRTPEGEFIQTTFYNQLPGETYGGYIAIRYDVDGNPLSPEIGEMDPDALQAMAAGFPTDWYRDECFLSGTLIDMWPIGACSYPNMDGTYDEHRIRCGTWQKPIEDIESGDIVVSYDANGHLEPGMVTQTFKNKVRHVLDFWGIGITPGHATLCGAGEFEGQHVPIMDILRTDGAIVRDDGTLVRAATCCEVGSAGDQFVHVILGDKQPDGRIKIKEHAELRLGTRIILDDGRDVSLQDVIEAKGGTLTEDGYVQDQNGAKQPFWWTYGESLPKPEDYILKRSDVELEAIYIAGEWESIGTQLTAPADRLAYLAGYKPSPNIPPAFKDRPDAPRAVSVLKPH